MRPSPNRFLRTIVRVVPLAGLLCSCTVDQPLDDRVPTSAALAIAAHVAEQPNVFESRAPTLYVVTADVRRSCTKVDEGKRCVSVDSTIVQIPESWDFALRSAGYGVITDSSTVTDAMYLLFDSAYASGNNRFIVLAGIASIHGGETRLFELDCETECRVLSSEVQLISDFTITPGRATVRAFRDVLFELELPARS